MIHAWFPAFRRVLVAALALLSSPVFALPPSLDTSDPLAAIDLNRGAIIADIVEGYQGDRAALTKRLSGLRADRLLSVSLASSRNSLEKILNEAEQSRDAAVSRANAKALGSPTTDLVYTPLIPCRLIDTRGFGAPIQGGAFAPNARRSYVPNGLCNLPTAGVASLLISFTTQNLTPNSGGYLAILAPATPVTASVDVFNLGAEWSASNTAVATGGAAQFDVLVAVANAHVVIDVLGYFAPPQGGAVPVASGGTGQTTLAPNGILIGQGTDSVAAVVGGPGQVLTATTGAPQWTSSPSLAGNLELLHSTATAGNIQKAGMPFLHDYGTDNTFLGTLAGNYIMTGDSNTVVGSNALRSNTIGRSNTASGTTALLFNTIGSFNTANGQSALANNTAGSSNTAIGAFVLVRNTTGSGNTASGESALNNNTIGSANAASGMTALFSNTDGYQNTASGYQALYNNTTGSGNIALGMNAGFNLTTGSSNIAIGNAGVGAEGNTIRIGDANQSRTFIAGIRGVTTGIANAVAVVIDSSGQLGTASSSRRVKDDIADMDAASSALMKLRPVTFHYKSDQNPAGRTLQYGLIAEEVAEVYPGLVAHSADGRIETVMYQFLASMLLNEYQKQQRTIEAQTKQIERMEQTHTAEIAGLKQAIAEVAELKQQMAHMARLPDEQRVSRVTAGLEPK